MKCPKCKSLMSDLPDTPCIPCELTDYKNLKELIKKARSRAMWSDRDTDGIITVLDAIIEEAGIK